MDYYEVLQLNEKSSQDEIKKAYQQLILQHHPDKSLNGNIETFVKLDEAYKILKDPVTRKQYDSQRFQQTSRLNLQMIIHETVRRSEFLYDESNEFHYHVCKCGGYYILDEDSTESDYIICCDECSLVIKVMNNKPS